MLNKLFIYNLIVIFLLQSVVGWAQISPRPTHIAPQNNFFIDGQEWKELSAVDFTKVGSNFFIAEKNGEKTVYEIKLNDEGKLSIINSSLNKKHAISIQVTDYCISKHMLFLTKKEGDATPGFYIIRLIDLVEYGFQSPMPIFFIPTDPSYGNLKSIVVEHDFNLKESRILLRTDIPGGDILQIPYSEIDAIIKIQIIHLATYQLSQNEDLKELEVILQKHKDALSLIFKKLLSRIKQLDTEGEFSKIFSDLRGVHIEEASMDDIYNILKVLNESPKLNQLKEEFAPAFVEQLMLFEEAYSSLMDRVKLSFGKLPQQKTEENIILVPEVANTDLSQKKSDTPLAIALLVGIATATLLYRFALPRMKAMSFNDMNASLSQTYFSFLNKPKVRTFFEYLFPNFIKNSKSSIATYVRSLGVASETEYSAIKFTGDQFMRAFWGCAGGSSALIINDLLNRELYRQVGDQGYINALLVDEPFAELHTLWIQKNFLFNVLDNQIYGTVAVTAFFGNMEKGYQNFLKTFLGNDLEAIMGVRLAEYQKRFLYENVVTDDLLELEQKIMRNLSGKNFSSAPKLLEVIPEEELLAVRNKWVSKIEDYSAITPEVKLKVEKSLQDKIEVILNRKIGEYVGMTPKKITVFQKISEAFGRVLQGSLGRLAGKKLSSKTLEIMKGSYSNWRYTVYAGFWNDFLTQTAMRGSFNGSIFFLKEVLMVLLIFQPVLITTYKPLKKIKMGIQGNTGEYLYGLAWGAICMTIYSYVFTNFYERPFQGTAIDLESSKYIDYLFGDEEKK